MGVIDRHEDDFLAAYKTHMSKVEKQLQMLKDKAKEQENKLNNDERIYLCEKESRNRDAWLETTVTKNNIGPIRWWDPGDPNGVMPRAS